MRTNGSENWLLKHVKTDLGLWQSWLPLCAPEPPLQSQRPDIQQQPRGFGEYRFAYINLHTGNTYSETCLNTKCLANAYTALPTCLPLRILKNKAPIVIHSYSTNYNNALFQEPKKTFSYPCRSRNRALVRCWSTDSPYCLAPKQSTFKRQIKCHGL